jgi:deoxyhypusine synthase
MTMPNLTKKELLAAQIQHIDITQHNVVPLVDAMSHMAYSARDTARAASIYDMMLRDTDCGVILCLAGSLISAGLQKIFVDLIRNNMVDAIVSTGANIVDQDFFEALGYRHYIAGDEYKYGAGDADLRELMIDRIYDTFIDEEELRICDDITRQITDSLEPRAYSSREFIQAMGKYLADNGRTPANGCNDSIVLAAYEKGVPIFCPAFSDCSAGFGLVAHQHARQGKPVVSIDSAKDFYEITKIKIENPTTTSSASKHPCTSTPSRSPSPTPATARSPAQPSRKPPAGAKSTSPGNRWSSPKPPSLCPSSPATPSTKKAIRHAPEKISRKFWTAFQYPCKLVVVTKVVTKRNLGNHDRHSPRNTVCQVTQDGHSPGHG